jgi:hypothetical protein
MTALFSSVLLDHHDGSASQAHVREYNIAAKSAGALGGRRKRLTSELLRYGIDGFTFVENEYYAWVCDIIISLNGRHLLQTTACFLLGNIVSAATLGFLAPRRIESATMLLQYVFYFTDPVICPACSVQVLSALLFRQGPCYNNVCPTWLTPL